KPREVGLDIVGSRDRAPASAGPEAVARGRAVGGILGPVAFIAAWVLAGAATEGYSPRGEAISELAARGASTRVVMTAGFGAFALGVWIAAPVIGDRLGRGVGWALRVAAVGTAGAAVFPLGSS